MSHPADFKSWLTIFACPRAFEGHFDVIQRNAIWSWTLLKPRPEIILLGNDAGTAEVAAEFGVRHVPEVKRTEYGTPLVNDLFAKGEHASNSPLLAYVNSDIILMDDFAKTVQRMSDLKRRFLLGGQRWDLDIRERLDFEPGWEFRLRSQLLNSRSPVAIDYFVFPRGLWDVIPPFVVGRFYWDRWLLYEARRKRKAWLIDATASIMAIHQNHSYPYPGGGQGLRYSPESEQNHKLSEYAMHCYSLLDATHRLTPKRLKIWLPGLMRIPLTYPRLVDRWHESVWFPILSWTRPLRHLLGFRKSSASRQ